MRLGNTIVDPPPSALALAARLDRLDAGALLEAPGWIVYGADGEPYQDVDVGSDGIIIAARRGADLWRSRDGVVTRVAVEADFEASLAGLRSDVDGLFEIVPPSFPSWTVYLPDGKAATDADLGSDDLILSASAGVDLWRTDGATVYLVAPAATVTPVYTPYLSGHDGWSAAEKTMDMIGIAGQSLALPRNATVADPILMRTPVHGAASTWMLDAGVYPNGANITALALLDEGTVKQSMAAPIASELQRMIYAATGRYQPMLVSNWSIGGQSIATRGRGGASTKEMLRQIGRAKTLAAAAGYRLVVRGIVENGGESDAYASPARTAIEIRDARLAQVARLNADVKAITGQVDDVLFVPYLTGREPSVDNGVTLLQRTPSNVVLGTLMAEAIDPRIVCSGPSYPDPYEAGDPTHIGPKGVVCQAFRHADVLGAAVYGTYGKRALEIVHAGMVTSTVCRVTYDRPVTIVTSDPVLDIPALGAGKGYDAAYSIGGASLSPTTTATAGDATSLDLTFSAAPTAPFWLMVAPTRPSPNTAAEYSQCYTAVKEATPFVLAAASPTGADLHHWACPQALIINPL